MVDKELSKQGIHKYYGNKIASKIARVYSQTLFTEKIPFKKDEVKKILFIQLYGIGDYLMSTPTIHLISNDFAKAKKTILCKGHSKRIAQLNPDIDFVATDKEKIKNEKFDLIVSLNDSAEGTLISNHLKAKYVIGFLKGQNVSANFEIGRNKTQNNIIENYLLIAKALGIKTKGKEYTIKIKKEKSVDALLKKNKINTKKFVVINPNTREGAEAKNWGNKNYAELCNKLVKKNYNIVFCGAKGEENSKKTINLIHNKTQVLDFTGVLELNEIAYLFSKAKCFIGNDTGLMHIALATQIPTIGIFGPTNSKRIFPKQKKAFAFQVKNNKWPCYIKGTFDVKPNQEFMDTIKVEEVFKKVSNTIKTTIER